MSQTKGAPKKSIALNDEMNFFIIINYSYFLNLYVNIENIINIFI